MPLVLAVACLGTAARSALAQGPDAETRGQARELALRGVEAFEGGDYATALDRFTRAQALYQAPSIQLMRARSLERLGRLVEALDAYEDTQHAPLADDAPAAFRDAVSDAKREADALRARIPRLSIHVATDRGTAAELHVLLDGKPVPGALLDVERPIDPGLHEVRAEAQGYESVTESVTAVVSEHKAVNLLLHGAVDASVSAESKAGGATRGRSGPSRAFWGWTAVGVGATGLAVSAVTGTIALGKKSTLDAKCKPGCPSDAAGDIDSFRSNRTWSYLSLGIGAAALGVGGYLLFSGESNAAHLSAALGPTGVRVTGAF